MMTQSTGTVVCLLAAAGLYSSAQAGNLEPPGPPGSTGRSTIFQADVPLTINTPGSYVAKENLTGVSGQNGITIDADDVTLDLNGFALKGVAGSLDGIRLAGAHKNIAIENGVVSGWGRNGIDAASSVASRFERLRVSNNSMNGIVVGGGNVTSCTSDANGGDGIVASGGNIISNCAASFNGDDGIFINTTTIVVACTAFNNTGDGIEAAFSSGDNSIIDNLCHGNDVGIHLDNAIDNRVEGNSLHDNTVGIRVSGTFQSDRNLIIRNFADNDSVNYEVPSSGTNFVGTTVTTDAAMNSSENGLVNICAGPAACLSQP